MQAISGGLYKKATNFSVPLPKRADLWYNGKKTPGGTQVKLPKPLTSFHLRTIALISMLIDHFGKVILSDLLDASLSVTNAMRASGALRDVILVAVHRHQDVH